MFKYLKGIVIWLFSKDTLGNVMFGLNIAKEVFCGKDGKGERKSKSLLRKLEMAQEAVDTVQKLLPNSETDKYAGGINKSKDKKTWGSFNAAVVKDKHGNGNNGINLGIDAKIGGIPVGIKYDPTNGSASCSLGIFNFNG